MSEVTISVVENNTSVTVSDQSVAVDIVDSPKTIVVESTDLSATLDILPALDNTYKLGSASKRWQEIHLGPGTLYITDQTLLTDAAITINDGVFNIDGIVQAQLPILFLDELRFNDGSSQTTAPGTPISYTPVIADGGSMAYTGTPGVGSYMKVGKLVNFHARINFTNFTNFGLGQYSLTVPFAPARDIHLRWGELYDVSTSTSYPISLRVLAGQTTGLLYAISTSQNKGADIALNHNELFTIASADHLVISGAYEAQ
jgi:hypothetical protein